MARKQPISFTPTNILAKVGSGKTILKSRKKDVLFSQGDAADAVFYIQEGRVKLTVVSAKGKEAVVAILKRDDFFDEGCLAGFFKQLSCNERKRC
jgi:CRP/FNR family transcriptional regulator, cyclic AMP receptor protein